MSTVHVRDADCTLDGDDTCTGCGVYHGDECPDCHGRGFHAGICLAALALSHAGGGGSSGPEEYSISAEDRALLRDLDTQRALTSHDVLRWGEP